MVHKQVYFDDKMENRKTAISLTVLYSVFIIVCKGTSTITSYPTVDSITEIIMTGQSTADFTTDNSKEKTTTMEVTTELSSSGLPTSANPKTQAVSTIEMSTVAKETTTIKEKPTTAEEKPVTTAEKQTTAKQATANPTTTIEGPTQITVPQQDLIGSSGVNIKLEIPMNELNEVTFKSAISDNTIIYCALEDSYCTENAQYISPEDVIIFYTGTKPYFDTIETVVVAASKTTHLSFYVKDPYTNTMSVMNSEQAESMLIEQKNSIVKDLGYNFTIASPYEKPGGFPGWATSLIVFCVICVLVFLYVMWRAKRMDEKKFDAELGIEKGTQAIHAEIIAEMNSSQIKHEQVEEKKPEQIETTTASQAHYNDIVAETGAPVVEKYLNKSLKDYRNTTNGNALHIEDNGKPDENAGGSKALDDDIPPPPPPPPVEFSEVDVHKDWQKEELPEPPKSPFDMDVAAEEATTELVNLVKEQTIELENSGIVNPGFTLAPDGTVMTEL